MNVADIPGETQTEHLGRRLAADVEELRARVDARIERMDPKQRDTMIRCLELIDAAWPECPVSQIEAIETFHLRFRLQFLISTALAD